MQLFRGFVSHNVLVMLALAFLVMPVQAWSTATSNECVPVKLFFPTGQAPDVRQVVVDFSETMVAFGDPRLKDPFDANCLADDNKALKGKGHWEDSTHWVYAFDTSLPAGVRCRFSPVADFVSVNGKGIEKDIFQFQTGGPSISVSLPADGSEQIDEDQIFLLGLGARADTRAVQQMASCEIDGVGERIPVQVIEGEQREKILREQSGQARNFFQVLTKQGHIGLLSVKDRRLDELPVIVAKCARRLPAGAKISLVWGRGINTYNGIATTVNQTLRFAVREAFTARSECLRMNPKAGCVPVAPVHLRFTAPVSRKVAEKITLKSSDGRIFSPTFPQEAHETVDHLSFSGPFSAKSTVSISLPRNFQDDAGRQLQNALAFPLRLEIDDDPPLIKFPSRFGILELHAQPMLPVSVRNVEATLRAVQARVAEQMIKGQDTAGVGKLARLDILQAVDDRSIAEWYQLLQNYPYGIYTGEFHRDGELSLFANANSSDLHTQTITLPRPKGSRPFELIGIPLQKPGFYLVEFASDRLGAALHGEAKPYFVSAGALVTNLSIHFKQGRESSLVWVTQLDNARPVAGAEVRVSTCDGNPLWQGTTDAKGLAKISELLPEHYYNKCSGLMVTSRKASDFSFMFSDWKQGIETWSFNLHRGGYMPNVVAHTIFDRPLFRAGEKVSMKHIVRLRTGQGFSSQNDLPGEITVTHQGSGETFQVPVVWNNGAGTSTWDIPKEAKLGNYTVGLNVPEQQMAGSFRVEQFRVPLMKAVLKPPIKPVVNAHSLQIDAQLNFLAGGAAAGAPVKFRSRLVNYPLRFSAYEDFSFGGGPPELGIKTLDPYAYDPESEGSEAGYDEGSSSKADLISAYPARTTYANLDANGGIRMTFDHLPKSKSPSALEVEMEYSDPNGQVLTTATRAQLLPSNLVLGLKNEGAFATRERMAFKVLALDPSGRPQAGRKIVVEAYSKKHYGYRKRMLGGFYAYEDTVEVRQAGKVCSGTSNAQGVLVCDGSAPEVGELELVAKSADQQGNPATASLSLYVADADNWYGYSQNDRIDLLPEKVSYEPGEKARIEVRMPFREATALVTVEREGILNAFVTKISAKNPYVDVPMLSNYGPNVYVSVMVIRGRITPETPGPFGWLKRMFYRVELLLGIIKQMPSDLDTKPTALVDLTKPAFKLGIVPLQVGWQGYTLKVKVEPERQNYRVRDHAKVRISVTDAAGVPARNAEFALAAVDEGLLQMAAPTSWNILESMMEKRPIEVETSTAQSQVIGKRHFGKKAAAPGGGGGQDANARELFDTLLLWRPSVKLDQQGQALIDISLNDALTAFRIAAIAHAGTGKFGTGSATIRASQSVMLFAGLPPYVREGDHFDAMLTVRNGGARALTLDLNAAVQLQGGMKSLGTQRVRLEAGAGTMASFPVVVPHDIEQLVWQFSAREVAAEGRTAADQSFRQEQDSLKFVQKVGAAYPVRVYQQTLQQLEPASPWDFRVQRPRGAIAGRGGIDIKVVNSLAGNFDAIHAWMASYPYRCMEQQASVAVAREDEHAWQQVMNSLPLYLDHDGLVRYFPADWLEGDDKLTAYLLTIAHEANYAIPEGARRRMLKGLDDFVAGRIHRHGLLQSADMLLRKLAAIDAMARYKLAKPEMLDAIEVNPRLWPSSGVIDWISILENLPSIDKHQEKMMEARQVLRSRMFFSGTTLTFSTEKQDYLWWLMVSPDLNAVRALRLLSDDADFPAADAARLARGALARQSAGRWTTTVANAWGVIALRHFQHRHEKAPVTGKTAFMLGAKHTTLSWAMARSNQSQDPTLGTSPGLSVDQHFDWPDQLVPLQIEHQGSGKPWAFVTSRAALPLEKPQFAGYTIKRTMTAVDQKNPGQWTRGDSYRVKLEIDAQTDMTWVVVNDPIPAGASILGNNLGGDSTHLVAGEKHEGWMRPAFEERAFDGYRAYYAYVPKGHFSLEYTVKLNNPGVFVLPASRIEAMYAPEIYGELPVTPIEVQGFLSKAPSVSK